jgi:monoterpene epsilon-lactone hydrolase
MPQEDIDLVRELIVDAGKRGATVAERRRTYEGAADAFALPRGWSWVQVSVGGVAAERISPPNGTAEAVLLFLHGGGYQLGSPRSHRHLAAALAESASAVAIVPDYRLAPEHHFPAALDDVLAVWRGLLEVGHNPQRIVIAGDSAGGGLVLSLMVAARAAALPLPAAAFLISPWLDLTCDAESYVSRGVADPVLDRDHLQSMAKAYVGFADATDPRVSPLRADLSRLPPMLVHVGDCEVLLDDSRRLATLMDASGGIVRLEVWPEMIHVWHWYLTLLPEAREAIDQAGAWIRARLWAPPGSDG